MREEKYIQPKSRRVFKALERRQVQEGQMLAKSSLQMIGWKDKIPNTIR